MARAPAAAPVSSGMGGGMAMGGGKAIGGGAAADGGASSAQVKQLETQLQELKL